MTDDRQQGARHEPWEPGPFGCSCGHTGFHERTDRCTPAAPQPMPEGERRCERCGATGFNDVCMECGHLYGWPPAVLPDPDQSTSGETCPACRASTLEGVGRYCAVCRASFGASTGDEEGEQQTSHRELVEDFADLLEQNRTLRRQLTEAQQQRDEARRYAESRQRNHDTMQAQLVAEVAKRRTAEAEVQRLTRERDEMIGNGRQIARLRDHFAREDRRYRTALEKIRDHRPQGPGDELTPSKARGIARRALSTSATESEDTGETCSDAG